MRGLLRLDMGLECPTTRLPWQPANGLLSGEDSMDANR